MDVTMPKVRYLIAVGSLVPLLFSGCAKHYTSSGPPEGKRLIAKVALFADGRLTVDGRPSDVKGLRACLKPVKRQHGSVWYFRQGGGPPPAIAMEVMRTLIDTQLPIRYSSHADFSDSTDEDG